MIMILMSITFDTFLILSLSKSSSSSALMASDQDPDSYHTFQLDSYGRRAEDNKTPAVDLSRTRALIALRADLTACLDGVRHNERLVSFWDSLHGLSEAAEITLTQQPRGRKFEGKFFPLGPAKKPRSRGSGVRLVEQFWHAVCMIEESERGLIDVHLGANQAQCSENA